MPIRCAAPAGHLPGPRRVWNKIPEPVAEAVVELALKQPELSPRELATAFVDQQQYFVSEASVYRLLKAHDLTKQIYRISDFKY
jgi:putative transposase